MTSPDGDGAHVGIVVVSHSHALATAAVALAGEMLHSSTARIAVAAGLDETTFGTDATAIVTAIEEVDGEAGVVVLMDLGSAVLSAELALDLLDSDETRQRVLLCPAPLVEGLVVGAVAAAGGATRQQVAAEAESALLGKVAALAPAGPSGGDPPPTPEAGAVTGSFTVANPHGLHARPAARLVETVRSLDAVVTLRNATTGSDAVPADSLSRLAVLGAQRGHQLEVSATGAGARDAVDVVLALAERQFDEADPTPASTAGADRTPGSPASAAPGVGIGPARQLAAPVVPVDEVPAGAPEAEWSRLQDAVAVVQRHLEGPARAGGDAQTAAVFDAHVMLLQDRELTRAARAQVDAGASAARAWTDAAASVEQLLAALPDPYLSARAADVRAVADQVLRVLAGGSPAEPVDVDGVLVATDVTPGQAAGLDPARVVAVVLAEGSPTSHAAMVLRARAVPAVASAGAAVREVADGTLLVVDGTAGQVLVDPPAEVVAGYRTGGAPLS